MRMRIWLFILLLFVLMLIPINVDAASSCTISATVCKGQSYVDTTTGGALGALRCFFLDTDSVLGNHVCSSTQDRTTWEMNAGTCTTLYYFDVTTGVTPPAVPNKVTIRLMIDNGATVVITSLSSGAEPANGATFSVCATNDGTNTGTARSGTYRIYLNLVKDNGAGGVGNYNIDSDGVATVGAIAQSARGALRGNMLVSALTASTPTGGVTFAYGQAGDESVTLTATRSQKNGGTTLETVNFDTRHTSSGSIVETSSTVESGATTTDTAAFVIDNTYDAASTTYDIEYNIVGNAALTSLSWTTFPSSGHGSGITQITALKVVNALEFTADPRIIFDKAGTNTYSTADNLALTKLTSSGGAVTALFNRGEVVYFETYIFNARSEKLSRSMTFITQDTVPTTCVSIGSLAPSSNKYSTTFTIPTSSTCIAAFDTTGTARTFKVTNTDQSKTSANSYFVSTYYWTDYHAQLSSTLSQDDFPTENANEQTSYIIAADVMNIWCHVKGVRLDINIQTAANEVILKNTETDDSTVIVTATKTTGSDGWTTVLLTNAPSAPGRAIHGHCDVTHNGNTGSATQSILWLSPYASDKTCRVSIYTNPQPNVMSIIYIHNEKNDVAITPNAVPTIQIDYGNQATNPDTWVNVVAMVNTKNVVDNTATVNGALYYYEWTPTVARMDNILVLCTIENIGIRTTMPIVVGAIGATGLQGEDGADGAQGIQGEDGADGAQGPQGETGDMVISGDYTNYGDFESASTTIQGNFYEEGAISQMDVILTATPYYLLLAGIAFFAVIGEAKKDALYWFMALVLSIYLLIDRPDTSIIPIGVFVGWIFVVLYQLISLVMNNKAQKLGGDD